MTVFYLYKWLIARNKICIKKIISPADTSAIGGDSLVGCDF
jgi:hypothetical protein